MLTCEIDGNTAHCLIEPDWWGRASAITGIVALIFAAVSVSLALRSRTDAERALVRERRPDFELSIVKEIADYLSRPMALREWYPYVHTLLMMVPGDDMSTIRDYYLGGPSDSYRWEQLGLQDDTVWRREIEDATRNRLETVKRGKRWWHRAAT